MFLVKIDDEDTYIDISQIQCIYNNTDDEDINITYIVFLGNKEYTIIVSNTIADIIKRIKKGR